MIIIYLQVEHLSNALAFNIKTLLKPSEKAIENIATVTVGVGGRAKQILLGAGFYPLYRGSSLIT
jgi:hypothetical protein